MRSAGVAAAVEGISGSAEAANAKVARWYELYLQRQPQGGEETGWVNLLRTQSDEQVLSQILGSEEFANRADKLFGTQNDPASFVKSLYTFIIGHG